MRIMDLRDKEVINICDGRRLGFVQDVDFDCKTGCIYFLIVPDRRKSAAASGVIPNM